MNKKIIWAVLRIVTILVELPFLIGKGICGLVTGFVETKVLDWEDDHFGWGWD